MNVITYVILVKHSFQFPTIRNTYSKVKMVKTQLNWKLRYGGMKSEISQLTILSLGSLYSEHKNGMCSAQIIGAINIPDLNNEMDGMRGKSFI